MKDERQTCTTYVDYENLVETLSHHQSLDIVTLLNDVLERARQQFRIQRILIFGSWTLYPLPAQLDTRGVIRRASRDPGTDSSKEIEESIIQGVASKESSEIYLLISGEASFLQAQKYLPQVHKRCVLWTLVPLSGQEQIQSTLCETIALPPALVRHKWPRYILLQALILETVSAITCASDSLALSELRDVLQKRISLCDEMDSLLSLALHERILFLQEVPDLLQEPQIRLNKRHEVVQKALQIQEHILTTVHVLQQKHGWVAFSVLEKALSTYRLFVGNQHFRHSWIELLIEHGNLLGKSLVRPGSTFTTTTISLNPADEQFQKKQAEEHNLTTLICIVNIFAHRRKKGWISTTQLHRYLTAHMTYTEARAILKQAQEEQVLLSEIRSGKRDSKSSHTIVWANHLHPLVQEKLAVLEHLLLTSYTLVAQRDFRTSESLLLEEFSIAEHFSEDEASYWLRLLAQEGIMRMVPLETHMSNGEHIVNLILDDPFVNHLLRQAEQRMLEDRE